MFLVPTTREARHGEDKKAEKKAEVYKDRLERALPWSLSPFEIAVRTQRGSYIEPEVLNQRDRVRQKSLRTSVKEASEGPWVDLMLDLALGTTFSNLTSNTKILSGMDAISYMCFFSLVWWIWTSQVAYNARFRQEDRLHRFYTLLQLCVFAALGAFTSSFDITSGIRNDPVQDAELTAALSALGISDRNVRADASRRSRLPILNKRGISLTMAFSRALLLLQYAVVFYHAKHLRNFSLAVPLISLTISTTMYIVAFLAAGDTDRQEQIITIALWYSPLVMEIIAHFIELRLPESVGYPKGAALYQRCSTLMTVIIGEGLNGITGVFHFVVGNLGFSARTVVNMLSTGLIVYAQFSIYFQGSNVLAYPNELALLWTFMHFFYFGCLILLLQAVENILLLLNYLTATTVFVSAARPVVEALPSITNVSADVNANMEEVLNKLGVSWSGVQAVLTNTTKYPTLHNQSRAFLRWYGVVLFSMAELFELAPESDSPEYYNYVRFLNHPTNRRYKQMVQDLVNPRATATQWFAGTAGGTLMTLAVLNVLQKWPYDRYAWATVGCRFFIGTVMTSLSLLNAGASTFDFIAEDISDQPSLAFEFLTSGWMLPSLAIALTVQVIVDYIILTLSVRAIKRDPDLRNQTSALHHQSGHKLTPSDKGSPRETSPLALPAEPTTPLLKLKEALTMEDTSSDGEE